MPMFNRDGESVDLPISFSREQRDTAFDLLGIPRQIGILRTTMEPASLTVEFYELGPDGKRIAHAEGAFIKHTVTIPMAGDPKARLSDYDSNTWS